MRKSARLIVAVFGIAFAVFVALQFRKRAPAPAAAPVVRTDPVAIAESTSGQTVRFNMSDSRATVKYDKELTYSDGSIKLLGVTIVAPERGGDRTFTVKAKEGRAAHGESELTLDGAVFLEGSDGMTVRTEHASYTDGDHMVRAPGPVQFTRGRLSGSGVGMTYDEARDVLSILALVDMKIAPDKLHHGATTVSAGRADFARREKNLRFEEAVSIKREGQVTEADVAVGFLSADGDHIQTVELRGHSRITMSKATPGSVQKLTANDMNLAYAADGESLDHAMINGDASIQLAGETNRPGRQIAAKTIDIALAPDGSTPTALVARESVLLTLPPEPNIPGRTIRSAALESRGEAAHGLTSAHFTGDVEFHERGTGDERIAKAATLDVALKPGFNVEDARFPQGVRFFEGKMTAFAAVGRYDLDKGTLALSGSVPGVEAPHVDNDQIAVDGRTIDVTLAGPLMKADGAPVKTVLQPPKKSDKPADGDRHMPAMLKSDQAVTVLSKTLDYDGNASKSTYTGEVRLFQGDTSIKAEQIMMDDKSGDLSASGSVTTTTLLETTDKDKKEAKDDAKKDAKKDATKGATKERVLSIAKAKDFVYEDATRRLTYTGDAHMTGPQGDMTAVKIELYLKPSGDELERAESYEKLTLREQNRVTTGDRLTYTTEDDKYVITGAPVQITDQCSRVTTGRTLTFTKATDTIIVDGNDQIRTQTKGGGKCPS